MSVIVRGMKMPEKCGLCDLFHAESPMHCTVVKGHKTVGAPYGMSRPEWCPLVEVPEPHGRLIDADALIRFVEDRYEITWESDCYEGGIKDACTDILEKISKMPTIEPERKKGKWITEAACSLCGFQPWYERDIHTLNF